MKTLHAYFHLVETASVLNMDDVAKLVLQLHLLQLTCKHDAVECFHHRHERFYSTHTDYP